MVDLLVTYMEMTAPPARAAVGLPSPDASVARERMDAREYLDLYRRIGEPVDWDTRLRMAPADLQRWLSDDANHVNVLRIGGRAVGLCEFDGVGRAEVELVHFGLDPAVHGKGLGTYLLDRSLRACWAHGPKRVWLHTDSNDHPSAAFVYARAGFVAYRQQVEKFAD